MTKEEKAPATAGDPTAPLLERIRERADRARRAVTRILNKGSDRETPFVSPQYVADLAAAIEMITIELAELRREIEEGKLRR